MVNDPGIRYTNGIHTIKPLNRGWIIHINNTCWLLLRSPLTAAWIVIYFEFGADSCCFSFSTFHAQFHENQKPKIMLKNQSILFVYINYDCSHTALQRNSYIMKKKNCNNRGIANDLLLHPYTRMIASRIKNIIPHSRLFQYWLVSFCLWWCSAWNATGPAWENGC